MIPKIRMSVRDMPDTVTQTSRVIKARKSYVLREGTVFRADERSADDVALDDGPAGREALVPEHRQVERGVSAVGDQLRNGATRCRRLLDAVAAEAVREDQVRQLGVAADDRVLVDHVVLVVTGPRANGLDG